MAPLPKLCIALGIFLLTAITFWPANRCELVNYDDVGYVRQNPHVQQGLTGANITWAFTTNEQANWHPLTWLSLMLDTSLFGASPAVFHRTNVLCHALSAALLFLAMASATSAVARSAALAILFAVHPLRVESVAWVAERKDVLSALFATLSLWTYALYARQSRGRWVWYGCALVAFALSLLAKASFITLPFLLLLLDYWPLGGFAARSTPRGKSAGAAWKSALPRVIEKLPLFCLIVVCAIATVQAQAGGGAMAGGDLLPLTARLANAAVSYVRYLVKLVRFDHLAFFYPYPLATGWPAGWVWGSAALLLAITAFALWNARRWPWLIVGWLWYLGVMAPMIGIIQVGSQAMADRYTYFPTVGLLLAGVWSVPDRWLKAPVGRAALGAVLVTVAAVLCFHTRRQIQTWQTDQAMCAHAIAVTDDNWMAEHGLAFDLMQAGDYPQAIEHCRQSIRIAPDNDSARVLLSLLLTHEGDFPGAAREYAIARRINDALPPLRERCLSLGDAHERSNQFAEAADDFRLGVWQNPQDAELQISLAGALLRLHHPQEAALHCQAALAVAADSPDAWDILGLAQLEMGERDHAITALRRAAQLDPSDAGIQADLAHALVPPATR